MSSKKLVLLPTDGSPTAEAAARFAEDIARAEQGTILLLGIAEPAIFDNAAARVAEPASFGPVVDPAVTAAIHDYTADVVAKEAAAIRQAGVEVEEVVVEAVSPHEAILKAADERQVDLIVMGTHGRSGLVRAVIGSVADRVIRHAKVPVLLVPLKPGD